MTRKKKTFMVIGLVLVIAVLLGFSLTGDNTKSTEVAGDEVTKRDIIELVSASGRVEPTTKVNITAEINAEIIQLAVKEGDVVRAGQLLIMLDTVQIRSDVDQALYNVNEVNARLEGAKAALENTNDEFDRQQSLFERTLTSERALKDARYSYLSAKSSAEATEAQARQAQFRYEKQLDYLGRARITSPMTGVVTFVDCEEGEIAAAQTAFTQGKTLMTVSDLSIFEVQVEVDETEINKIDMAQKVAIEVDAFPDTTFEGKVVEIGNTAIVARAGTQDQATNFYVTVQFTDSNVKVKPGMSATVDITTNERKGAASISFSAVVMRSFDMDSLEAARTAKPAESSSIVSEAVASDNSDNDKPKKKSMEEIERKELKGVFVIREGIARFVEVETGISDQKHIEVTSGLEPGDSVVSGPYKVLRSIKDGDVVKIADQEGKEKP